PSVKKKCVWLLSWLVGFVSTAPAFAADDSIPVFTVRVDVAKTLGPLEIGKLASLGQGGQSEDPMWEGRAAEVRALRPRIVRLFLQESDDVLPAKGAYHWDPLDKLVDLTRRSGAEPMMCICCERKLPFPRIDPEAVEQSNWDEWGRL